MSIHSLLTALKVAGVKLWLDGNELRFKAPKGALTPELKRELKTNKQAVIDKLRSLTPAKKEVIPQRPVGEKIPASFSQQRLWISEQLQGEGLNYNMTFALRVEGHFDIGIAEQSINRLIGRHEVLRTVYVEEPSGLVQVVNDEFNFAVIEYDIRDLNENNGSERLQAILRESAQKPFDLSSDLMVRVTYVHMSAKSTESGVMIPQGTWLFDIHHIASDGWSMAILVNEFVAQYEALVEGKPNPFPALEIQYADYAHWQHAHLNGDGLRPQLAFWQQQLGGVPAVHSLPLDFVRPEVKQNIGANFTGTFDVESTRKIKRFSQQQGVTLFMLLHATLGLVLSRHSNSSDIVIGTPVANRQQPETASLIGAFMNTLVLRTDTSYSRFEDYLNHVRQVNTDSLANQNVPIEMLLPFCNVSRSTAHGALIQIMFRMDTNRRGELSLPGVSFIPMIEPDHSTEFDLDITAEEVDGKIIISWKYDTALFTAEHMENMLGHFQQLLTHIVESPQDLCTELPMLSDEETHYLLYDLNHTDVDALPNKSLHQLFEEQVEKTPENIALVFEGESLTYQELNHRANQLARAIQVHYQAQHKQDLQPDTLIALYLDRSLEMVISILAVLKAGAAYVPISTEYPQERTQYILQDAKAPILLTQQGYLPRLDCYTTGLETAPIVVAVDKENTFTAFDSVNLSIKSSPTNLAYVIYTSGTTGKPKGVMVCNQGQSNLILWYANEMAMNEQSRILTISPYVFDLSQKNFLAAFAVGGAVIVAPGQGYDVESILNCIDDNEVTLLNCSPNAFYPLTLQSNETDFQRLSSLKNLVLGGEPINLRNMTKWIESPYFQCEIVNSYGPTECSDVTTYYRVKSPRDYYEKSIPIGKAVHNIKHYVLGSEQKLVPRGAVGELYLGGVGVARGYLNRTDLTSERFIENPFASDDEIQNGHTRIYQTGDLVRWLPDGNLEYLGRNDQQVKIRGYRIELGEIESVLVLQGGIKQAVVIDWEHDGNQYLCAYVVPEAEIELDADALSELLASQLPEFMVPSYFIKLDEIPRTINGKLDRRGLPEPEFVTTEIYVGPRTELESQLCGIWQSVLGLEQVGIHDNFFRLGGNSISAIRLSAASQQAIGIDVPLPLLFEHKTIAGLARVLGNTELVVIPKHQLPIQPLSFAQERLLFIEKFEQGTDAYHIPVLVKLDTGICIDVLEQAINVVVERHPVLNAVYRTDGQGNHYQQILTTPVTIHSQKLAEDDVLAQVVEMSITRPFDLENESPIRVRHYEQAGSQYLSFLWHHIAFDGWSMEVFLQELSQAYVALAEGCAVTLPELSITYGDYAAWQRDYLQGDRLASLLEYWTSQLSGVETLDLPLDHPRPVQFDYQGRGHDFVLDVALSAQLRQMAQNQETTLYTVMLSAFYINLATLSGQNDIVIGTPSDNRHHAQTQSLIGFFINSLPLRCLLDKNLSVSDVIEQVHRLVTEAKVHQELPFERLVDTLGLERDTSRHPLFQVMFSVQSFTEKELREHTSFFTPVTSDEQSDPRALYDLSLFINDGHEKIAINLNYAASLFERVSMTRFGEMYQQVLTAMVTKPQQVISEIDLISAQDRHTLLQTWNQTDAAYPQDQTLNQLFEEQVESSPDSTALVFDGESLTYRELNNRANQLARAIRAQYQARHNQVLQPDTLIALYLDRSLEMIISILAVLKAGGAYVPISPEYPAERTQYILEDTRAGLLLTQHHHLQVLDDQISELASLSPVCMVVEPCLTVSGQSTDNLSGVSCTSDLAYIIYTSGTTGKPKGVALQHDSVLNTLIAMSDIYDFSPECNKSSCFSNYTFDVSVSEIFNSLLFGGELHLFSQDCRQNLFQLSDYIVRHQLNFVFLPPSVLGVLPKQDFPSLKALLFAGEKCDPSLCLYWSQRYNLYNYYGPTEASIYATGKLTDERNLNEIGRSINNGRLYVLDSSMHLLPIGCPGELYIGGAGLARGYLNRLDLTAERFIANPFATQADREKGYTRLYKTGDLVRWLPDGNLEYLGRNDSQVKIRGYRIELGEIESVLTSLDGIQQAVVIDRERDGHHFLSAYVVAQSDATFEQREIHDSLVSQLPDYMVPSSFTLIDAIPLTINGKLDRNVLPEPELVNAESYVVPRTDLESRLCELWQAVLGLEQVGIDDNFFRIGGDSIVSIQLVSRLRTESFNVQVSDIFDAPTVAQLALLLETERSEITINADQGLLHGEFELLPIQSWFFDQGFTEAHHWNQSFAIRITADITAAEIEPALKALAEQHDMLRASFQTQHGAQYQQYLASHDSVMAPIQHIDISSTKDEAALFEEMTQWQRSFDIEQGPLWRTVHVTGCEDGYARLVFVFHHLIIDAVSWRILAEDMASLLTGHSLGQKSSSYRQWVDVVSTYPQLHPDEGHYWDSVMSEPITHTELSAPQFDTVSLSAQSTEKLLRIANQGYHTEINDVLLSALNMALQATFARDTHHILLEGHGREELDATIDVSRTVGWFTTQYPVCLITQASLAETIIQTKEMLRTIPNKGIGFGACCVSAGKKMNLPTISFNYLGQFHNTAAADDGLWQLTAEPTGEPVSSRNHSDLLLNINGAIQQGQLTFSVGSQLLPEITSQFITAFEVALDAVNQHCCEVAKAGGVKTPSDFDTENMDISQLEMIQEQLNKADDSNVATKVYEI